MKMKQPHIVPLSRQALETLEELKPLTGRGKYLFPSPRTAGRPMSDNAILDSLRHKVFAEFTGAVREVDIVKGVRPKDRPESVREFRFREGGEVVRDYVV